MIELKKLQELVSLMVENDLIELDIRDGDESVSLSRPNPHAHSVQGQAQSQALAPAPTPAETSAPAGGGETSAVVASDEGLLEVQSPMVGTFYSAPKPEAPPFVKVGDHVSPDTVVCLIEAMKVFSEVKAEVSGTVRKIVAKNSDSVEFGEPLLLVEPD
jgi:acetyl-CoA carboxylase biotin carboxyl carrier protein